MENASKALIIAGAILIAILLIGIGVLLVTKGTDITATGTAGIDSQKIQSFNGKFTAYQGVHKGSELKGLESLVRSSNASDRAHQVYLAIGDATDAKDNAVTTINGLTDSKNYSVVFTYMNSNGSDTAVAGGTKVLDGPETATTATSEAGYICGIVINDAT